MAEDGLELEEGYFDPDFKVYAERELNWSLLDISGKPDDVYADSCVHKDDDSLWKGISWVFWSRQDEYPERPRNHDNFVGSKSDACPSPDVRENIRLALHKMILDPCLNYALVQFWAPTKTSEGRTFLTTQHQHFALGRTLDRDSRQRLCEYRMEMCREYNNCFYADAEGGEEQLGVPGRVFLHKLPEFNPDVKYCSLKEYPQRDLALRCGIIGYLAPVFEQSSRTCVGVLEISILDPWLALYGYQKDFLRHVFDKFQGGEEQLGVPGRVFLHKLPEFNPDVKYCSLKEYPQRDLALRCSIIGYLAPVFEQSSRTVGVLEISILDPWLALYGYQKDFLRHVFDKFQEFGLQCISGCKDCEMRDEDKDKDKDKNNALAVAFKELEMVLESVTGRILTFPKLSYCSDVKQFSIAEYPLVTHVRRLKLSGCFTMCLLSSRTGSELYVLEFFLPPISKDDDNILTRLSSILRTVEENSQTFKLACSQEFGGGLSVEVIDFPNGQRSHSIRMIEDTRVFPTLVPLEDGGGVLQLSRPDQPSMDAVNSRMNGVSEALNYNLPSVEPLQNGEVATQLDSSDQSSMDPSNNEQNVVTAKRSILAVTSSEESKRKTQKVEHNKNGVKIAVPLEDILKCSKMSRDKAAGKLDVSISTLKRLCRDYGIIRWPPRNMKTVHSPRPLPFENQEQTPRLSPDLPSNQVSAQEQTPRLSSDLPLNQVSASVVRIKPESQDKDLLTIKAKYESNVIKFRLSLLSTLVELHQEVAKRLHLEAGSYSVKYKDEEDEWILIACDDDLQDCARHFTSIVVQLEPKQTS